MNDLTIRDMCRDLGAMDWDKLADRLCRLNQHDRAGTTYPDGYKSQTINGDIPANDPEAMTPTERAADVRAFGTPEPDPIHTTNVLALAALLRAHQSSNAVVDHVCRAEKVQRWEKPVGQTSTECKSVGCDGTSVARGWCDACRKWIARNPTLDGLDPVTVPELVIEERTKRREKAS